MSGLAYTPAGGVSAADVNALVEAAMTKPITSTFSLARAVDGANATSVATGQVLLLSADVYNARTGGVSLLLFDKAGTPSPGTDTAKWTIYLPALTTTSPRWDSGLRFTAGLAFALLADDGASLMAGDVAGLNLGYTS